MVAVYLGPGVDGDEHPGPDDPRIGEAVDDLVVDGDADGAGEGGLVAVEAIALERWPPASAADVGFGEGVELAGRDPRAERLFDEGEDLGDDPPCSAHRRDLLPGAASDHRIGHRSGWSAVASTRESTAARSAVATASMDCVPSISRRTPVRA